MTAIWLKQKLRLAGVTGNNRSKADMEPDAWATDFARSTSWHATDSRSCKCVVVLQGLPISLAQPTASFCSSNDSVCIPDSSIDASPDAMAAIVDAAFFPVGY